MNEELKSVPLEQRHVELGAKMVPFAGFSMPLQYIGIKDEHHAVRNDVGIFDVSHMGEVEFTGPNAVAAVDRLVTNDASSLSDGQAMYTVMCNEEGGIVDDLVVYRINAEHMLICMNAANREKDFAHMQKQSGDDVELANTSDDWAQLAVQGPGAELLLAPMVADGDLAELGYYRGAFYTFAGARCFISRTGYTGEDGFELYIPAGSAVDVFDAIMDAGEGHQLQPCGLGARDTLRLEAKYHLYGNDMDETVNPLEAGLGWVVKLNKESDFVGKQALREVKEAGVTRRLRGVVLEDRGVLRPGYPLFVGDEKVGELTSGGYAPTLEKSIGLGWVSVEHANDDLVDVEVRGRRLRASLTKKAFYKRDD